MAIETQCPACKKNYRLKDELAGKKVTCANPSCRFVFQVPKIGTGTSPTMAALKSQKQTSRPEAAPPTTPSSAAPPNFDPEAAALAALADEPEPTTDTRTIDMSCEVCDYKWTEPWDKQGKNTICPDCRHRQKVPIPKAVAAKKQDWRQGGGGPSLARREQLEGVTASGDASYVSGEALRNAGLGLPELEPRPLWQKIFVVAFPLLILGLSTLTYFAYSRSKTDADNHKLIAQALEALPDETSVLPKRELPFIRAALLLHAFEYQVRREKETQKDLQDALALLNRARQELENAPTSLERDFLFIELATKSVNLGGSQEQIDAGQRIRYTPQGGGNARARISEKSYDVQTELRLTMNATRGQDRIVNLEIRKQLIRQCTRALLAVNEVNWLDRLMTFLFTEEEQLDALAIIAWEIYKGTGDRTAATEFVSAQGVVANPSPALIALAQVVEPIPSNLRLPNLPGGSGPIDDYTRYCHGYTALLKNNPTDAIELAKRPGRIDARLRLLALSAELAPEPASAVLAAAEIVANDGRKRELGIPADDVLIRLAFQAGRANLPDAAEVFAKATTREEARTLARADFLRGQLTEANPVLQEAILEIPSEPKNYHLGHAWGRLTLARAKARSGQPLPPDRYQSWGAGLCQPFGLVGHALGRQDAKLP